MGSGRWDTFGAMAQWSEPVLRRSALGLGAVALLSGLAILFQAWADVLSPGSHALVIGVFLVSMAAAIGFGLAALERGDPPIG